MLNNILKVYPNLTSGKGSFPRWRPRWVSRSYLRNNYKTENDKERCDHRSLQKLTADFRRMNDTIHYLENQSRRNNLRIDGVKERAEETWADTEQALRKVLETDLKMPTDHVKAIAIERAHRTGGAQNADRDRTVVVKFTNFKERETPCYRPLELIGLAAYSSTRTSLCESSVGEKS